MKKIPLRTCIVTKEKCEKRELLRVVRTPEGQIVFDASGKANGKGAYLKKDSDVILKAQKNKILDRIFEMEVPTEIYTELLGVVNE
ncbi:MAG: YlxR family protein [Firmicutes bacterium]|nr:YlxR family protein [Bacillota bacterium]